VQSGASTRKGPQGLPLDSGPAGDLLFAIEHLRSERLDLAEPVLERVLKRHPRQADALHFLGVLRHAQGRTDEAIASIRSSLTVLPRNAGAWNNLGNVLLLAQRADEAAEAYSQAVEVADPRDAQAALSLGNLGALYRRLGRLEDSERACRRAVELDERCGDAWYQLSTTLIRQRRVHDGVLAYCKAVALWPAQQQSRGEVIRALLTLGEHERAAALLRDWLTSDAGNPVASHMLAACAAADGAPAPERASDAYVRQVFDGFAASFDSKLEALHYQAPRLVGEALAAAGGAPAAALDIVDVGCGTGLCAPHLRPYARRLYDVLHQAELTHYLATQPGAFDVVLSADTLCYFGALEGALAAANVGLRGGGILVFTVEALAQGSGLRSRLQTNGRYAHDGGYVRSALEVAGFHGIRLQPAHLRMEAGEPVAGWVLTAVAGEVGRA
jgi:predicted TPR repeat methyltransferase